MSTKPINITNGEWTAVYSGPTTTPISVEKDAGGAAVWLAISQDIPELPHCGHFLLDGVIRCVELDNGESLYAYSRSTSSHNPQPRVIITD